jgi:hypothetical protein
MGWFLKALKLHECTGVPLGRLFGGAGDDVLSGGEDADILDGGVGDDMLIDGETEAYRRRCVGFAQPGRQLDDVSRPALANRCAQMYIESHSVKRCVDLFLPAANELLATTGYDQRI